MAGEKFLRPPFVWANQKDGLQEDKRFKRWSIDKIRMMKNGLYNWEQHEEKTT